MPSPLPTFDAVWQQPVGQYLIRQLHTFSPEQSFVLGCSGGKDSMLLLHMLAALCPDRLRVLHINHQLQTASAAWAAFVQQQCAQLAISCSLLDVTVTAGNLEQQARIARYHAFADNIETNEILVTAHHANDQAETVINRLFSGSGLKGLGGILSNTDWGQLSIWRPLLATAQTVIDDIVRSKEIEFMQDPMNEDDVFQRVWMRKQLFPLLEQRYPQVVDGVNRSAELLQDAWQVLSQQVQQDLQKCSMSEQQLSITALQDLTAARQRLLLSEWMQADLVYAPSFAIIEQMRQQFLSSREDASPELKWNGFCFRRFKNQLFRIEADILLNKTAQHSSQVAWQIDQSVTLASGTYQIAKQSDQQLGLSLDLLESSLCLKPRRGGERVHLHGRVGHWPLKKALQQAEIAPWLRQQTQLLYKDNELLGVFCSQGFWLAQQRFLANGGWLPILHQEIY